jgi:hypothetical protein
MVVLLRWGQIWPQRIAMSATGRTTGKGAMNGYDESSSYLGRGRSPSRGIAALWRCGHRGHRQEYADRPPARADSYTHQDAQANLYRDPDPNRDADPDQYALSNHNAVADEYAYPDSCAADAHLHARSAHQYPDAADAYLYTCATAHQHAQADSQTAAQADQHAQATATADTATGTPVSLARAD